MLWLHPQGSHRRRPRAGSWLAVSLPLLPVAANSFGWIFTEMGRQPWAVFGLMTTASGVSPGVSVCEALTSLIGCTLLYAVLAVDRGRPDPAVHQARRRPVRGATGPTLGDDDDADRPLAFAY